MSLRILLVLPAVERVRVTLAQPEVPRRSMLRFSVLPLTVVAALTPSQHHVRIIDENVEPLDFNAECDLVGISFMTALAPRAYEIAAEFHRRGKLVVAGGYHATLCPDDAAPHFDSLVLGEAKGAWEQVLADAEAGCLRQAYRGDPHDLHTPVPRRDLLAHTARHYATINAVQAGRGCRHNCRYCSVTAFHNGKVSSPNSGRSHPGTAKFAQAFHFRRRQPHCRARIRVEAFPRNDPIAQTLGQPVFGVDC